MLKFGIKMKKLSPWIFIISVQQWRWNLDLAGFCTSNLKHEGITRLAILDIPSIFAKIFLQLT